MADYFVNGGKSIVTNRILGSGTEPKNLGWGTGAGSASASSTDLSTPKDVDLSGAGPARTAGTSSQQTTTLTGDTYRVVTTRTATGSGTVTNFGLFDATSGGNLFVISDGQSVALVSGDSLQVTYNLKFT